MRAIHLRTRRLREEAAHVIEAVLAGVRGVIDVAIVRSAGLVSVLYDESLATAEQISRALRRAGYPAHALAVG
jgi:copper chaperone CopZ